MAPSSQVENGDQSSFLIPDFWYRLFIFYWKSTTAASHDNDNLYILRATERLIALL